MTCHLPFPISLFDMRCIIFMVVGWVVVRCTWPPSSSSPPLPPPPIWVLCPFYILENVKNFRHFNDTISYFWNNFSQTSSINGYSNVRDGSKNIKYYKYDFGKALSNNCLKKCLLSKNVWYYKIISKWIG